MQVEVLKFYRVVDMACGSGDVQILCIIDDDNVWFWGDGDYGKFGKDILFFGCWLKFILVIVFVFLNWIFVGIVLYQN